MSPAKPFLGAIAPNTAPDPTNGSKYFLKPEGKVCAITEAKRCLFPIHFNNCFGGTLSSVSRCEFQLKEFS
jgi:hypothetical protein